MIQVLLVDDEQMVCAHLRSILGSAPDIEVVGEAYDGVAGSAMAQQLRPDLVLMDLAMPGLDGFGAIRAMVALDPPVRVVVLTVLDSDVRVAAALRAGAAGFLVKAVRPHDLINLVRVAAAGHTVLSPGALLGLARRLPAEDPQAVADRITTLTARERDVARELTTGASNASIAASLSMTESTVKGHVSRILLKLKCENRTQATLALHPHL